MITPGERHECQVSSSLYLARSGSICRVVTMDEEIGTKLFHVYVCSILTSEFVGSGWVC